MKQREPVKLDITVQISAEAMQKLWLWTGLAKGEVSALGLVEEIKDPDTGAVETLRVTDFVLLEQICDEAETEIDPRAIAELMELVEDPSRLRCWAHSHGDMGAFWSDQDTDCIEGLANGEYLLSLVVNKKREAIMRLDVFHLLHLYINDVVYDVHYPLVKGLEQKCRKEFKDKVIEGFGLAKITKSYHQPAISRLGILPDELDDDLYWQGVEEADDLEEISPF